MKLGQDREEQQESLLIAQKCKLNNQVSNNRYGINWHLHRLDSQSSEESFETIAPSISATSASSSDADDIMTKRTSLSRQDCDLGDNQSSSVPLELSNAEDGDNDYSDVISSNGSIYNEEEKLTVPANVSLLSNGSHKSDNSAFHSLPFDDWETADEFGTEHERNYPEDNSTDSFGPLGQFNDDEPDDPFSIYDVSGELDLAHQQDGSPSAYQEQTSGRKAPFHQPLSVYIKCSTDTQAKATPRRRRIALNMTDPQSPPRLYIHKKSRQARAVIKKKNAQAKEKYSIYLAYRARRKAAKELRKSPIIVIPSNHRLKIMWDMATIALTFVSAYVGHIYIRDKSTYEWDWFVVFTNSWFFVDLLLNFFTEHRTADGTVMKTGREVWGRYLTTWFAIDALSLLPWERLFLRPIIQRQKRRNVVVKWFFRSKAVVKVTVSSKFYLCHSITCFSHKRASFSLFKSWFTSQRILKGRHVKAFGKLAQSTKRVGIGGKKLLRLIIKYLPKYILFYRNMKGVLVLKTLRLIHVVKKTLRGLKSKDNEDDRDDEESIGTIDLTEFDADSDMSDYFDDQSEIEGDDFENSSMSHCASGDADYESCVDDEDYDFDIQCTNIPNVQRTARTS